MDVVVVGSGAAGIAAARAAREAGAAVTVVTRGPGGSSLSSGVVWSGPREPFETWADRALVRVGGRYVTVGGWLVAGATGAVASLLDLATVPAGAMVGVVDLPAHPSWSARYVAETLGGRRIPVKDSPRGETFARVAAAFDTDGVAEGLAHALRDATRGLGALLFPPVLGLQRLDVAARMAQLLGMPVGEAAGGPGDPPGIRLEHCIRQWLPPDAKVIRADARVETGEGPLVRLSTGEKLRPKAVVLATGGLAGGGLVFEGALREATAALPVWTRAWERVAAKPGAVRGADPREWFDEATGRAQGAGVRTDPRARVRDASGADPVAPWLFAAGEVVLSPTAPSLASALAAGALAGREAAGHALG